jgi:hypothetical protein
MSALHTRRIRLLATTALLIICASARADDPSGSKAALTLEKERLLAQKQTLEETTKRNAQESLAKSQEALEKSRRRIADLKKLWQKAQAENIPSLVDSVREAIRQETERNAEIQKEIERLKAAIDSIDKHIQTIGNRVAQIDRQVAAIDADKFKYRVTIDAGYAGSATFDAGRYNDAYRFRKSLDHWAGTFSNISGPEHPFTGDYTGVSKIWVVSYWVDKPLTYKTFDSQAEAEACQKKLLNNGLHAHWERVAR